MTPIEPSMALGTRCLRCGYNLAGLRHDGVCPECGLSVERSLAPVPLAHLDAQSTRQLIGGSRFLRRSILCVAALPLVLACSAAFDMRIVGVLAAVVAAAALGLWTLGWARVVQVTFSTGGVEDQPAGVRDQVARGLLVLLLVGQLASFGDVAAHAISGSMYVIHPLEAGIAPIAVIAVGTAGIWRLRIVAGHGPGDPLSESCSDLLSLALVNAGLVAGVVLMAFMDLRSAGGFAVLLGVLAIGIAMHLFSVLREVDHAATERLAMSS